MSTLAEDILSDFEKHGWIATDDVISCQTMLGERDVVVIVPETNDAKEQCFELGEQLRAKVSEGKLACTGGDILISYETFPVGAFSIQCISRIATPTHAIVYQWLLQ